MQQQQLKGSLMLLACALICGLSFVAQSVGSEHVGPFTFNGIRSLIGAFFLINRPENRFPFGVLLIK